MARGSREFASEHIAEAENQITALARMLEGSKFKITIGDWTLNNSEAADVIDFNYHDIAMVYTFFIENRSDLVIFKNFHRQAEVQKQGVGTASLESLETMLRGLARRLGKPVAITFPLGKRQPITARWLANNNYQHKARGDVYYKIL